MSKTFRQYDSRWGSKNYNGSSTMAAAGCGPTSVACIAYNQDTSITPWKVAQWMQSHGYAIRNNGTAWAGIPAALKAFGCEDVKNPKIMKDIFDIMKKDGYCAVFLFRGGTRGGVTWTTSGHYLAVSDYKVVNGKHYFYMRDPGQRKHDGWYCYETKMLGLIVEVWTCYCPKINGQPRGITAAQDLIGHTAAVFSYKLGTSSSKYKYPSGKPLKAYKDALNKGYPNRGWSKPAHDGASCDVFVGVTMRATVDKKFPRGFDEQWDYVKKHPEKYKSISASSARRGDIIQYWKSGGGVHTCIITGKYVAEAGYNNFYPKRSNSKKTRLSKSGKKSMRIVRYIG